MGICLHVTACATDKNHAVQRPRGHKLSRAVPAAVLFVGMFRYILLRAACAASRAEPAAVRCVVGDTLRVQ